MTHYFQGGDGDSFVESTIHATDQCDELEGAIRPLADSTVESYDADLCSECTDAGSEGESESEESETETCEVVKSDGEVCGRERPCGYHD